MSKYRATITVAPDFAYALTARFWSEAIRARPEIHGTVNLSSLTMAVSGGEMVRVSTLAAFGKMFSSCGFDSNAFHPYYGLTETMCTSVTQHEPWIQRSISRTGVLNNELRPPLNEEDEITLVGNGSPVGDTELLVVDPINGAEVGSTKIGEIWVRGSAVTPGYAGSSATAMEWQGRLNGDSAETFPFFRTGDLGFLYQGQIFITGRLKELVIVRGKNHYPLDIETTVRQRAASQGVIEGAAFSVTDANGEEQLGLAVEVVDLENEKDDLEQSLRSAISTQHGLSIERLFVMPKASLPRTATQKISRLTCGRLAQAGDWKPWELQRASGGQPAKEPQSMLASLSGQALEGVVLGQVLAQLGHFDGIRLDAAALSRPISSLGLSSLQLAQLLLELRRSLGVDIPFGVMTGQPTLHSFAAACVALINGEKVPTAPVIDWQDSVQRLCSGINGTGLTRTHKTSVLLTGATGFLGSWLLHSLLTKTSRTVTCLVRAESPTHGRERLKSALERGPGWSTEFQSRLTVITGDLKAPNLGLTETAFAELSTETGVILHNAADVNFVAPYEALAASNVEPLGPLLALATTGGLVRPLHFVSTTAIFNGPGLVQSPLLREVDFPQSPVGIFSGYARSKWVAEAVLREASQRGLPIHVHRPSLVVGDSRTGQSHTDDLACRFIKGCVELGSYPEADISLNLIGVDQCATGIVSALESPDASAQVLHWSGSGDITLRVAMGELRRQGHAVEPRPLNAWLEQLQKGLPHDNALFPLQEFLLEKFPDSGKTLLEVLDGLPVKVDVTHSAHIGQSMHLSMDSEPLPAVIAQWMDKTGYLTRPAFQTP